MKMSLVLGCKLKSMFGIVLISCLLVGCPFGLPRNTEHLRILEQGVDVWNQWREDNPEIAPVLVHFLSELEGASLKGVNFSGTVLAFSYLSSANLMAADLTGSALDQTVFVGADLSTADLSGAGAVRTDFTEANLTEANLAEANLLFSNFAGANLTGANLSGIIGWEDIHDIRNCNIFGVQNAPEGFLEFALANGAIEIE